MASMSRRDVALAVMAAKLIECREQGSTPEQTAKAIDAAYPFGDRSHHPYKAWLEARKEFFIRHNLPRRGARKFVLPDMWTTPNDMAKKAIEQGDQSNG